MQSGIKASEELQVAFKNLLSNTSERGLIAGISSSSESLIPQQTIPSSSPDFSADLANLGPLITDNAASYIVLRLHGETGAKNAAGNFVAITYVPDHAPVRQKMLFASTRLTLVRELGTEHFASTLFATTKAELTAEGWAKHEAHDSISAPLTEEEQNLVGIREAEAQESTGTATRRGGHVHKQVGLPIDSEAADALGKLKSGELGLVQLQIDVSAERLVLASTTPAPCAPSSLSSTISATSPRYSFYSDASSNTPSILFIYTCPSTSSIKERMLYASSRNSVIHVTTPEIGITITKKIEAGGPDEVTEDVVMEEMGPNAEGAGPALGAGAGGGDSRAFSRPKRPGRR